MTLNDLLLVKGLIAIGTMKSTAELHMYYIQKNHNLSLFNEINSVNILYLKKINNINTAALLVVYQYVNQMEM